ncbi:MAG TPA: zf-HC2 domain-containing protein [Pyrinomonadaceae bacterium]|nr:zf-HC2 domain-containing protein [Pyrinomonadaceae bacterium]
MSSATSGSCVCKSEEIAAYLDGELEASACALFEQHVRECSPCAAKLQEQRRLLCTLDLALGDDPALALPKNYAEVVATRAQADMSGARCWSEHRQALWLCAALALVSFALLGAAAGDVVLKPAVLTARHLASFVGFLSRMLYDAGAGLALILRALGGRLILEAHPLAPFAFLLFAMAVALLSRLIIKYHRARVAE